jgi:hypothetical protein
MYDNKDRVNVESIKKDQDDEQSIIDRTIEIKDEVDRIMGGDNEELVLEAAADSDAAARAILDLAVIDCSKPLSQLPKGDWRALMTLAYKLNKAIEKEVTATLESRDD